MEEITSVNNTLVKETVKFQQKKYRDIEGKFLVEGYKPIEEAAAFGIEFDYVFINKDKQDKYEFLKGRKILTTEIVLKKLSAADTPAEAVGVARQVKYDKDIFKSLNKVILLENIRDLGNLGTIIRTACAFNVDGIILYGNCADMYNPKCVRSAVGNLWKIPILYLKNISDLKELFENYQRVATLPRSSDTLKTFKPKDKILMMFGSEADGLSEELIRYSTDSVKIEMNKQVESLNLAISCAIVMYAVM